jgi:non-heme chloroperoxidase
VPGQPIVFSHGWSLSSDDWDAQMLFFLHHDVDHDVDHYADDLAELTAHLDLHDAVHVGHSAGGGVVARYIGRRGESRVAKAVLISAVTPPMLQTDANPAGVPQAAFEGFQASTSPASSRPRRSSRTGGARA